MSEPALKVNEINEEFLLEQYKLCVQMADKISSRREKANKFYLTVLSSLLALLSIVQANFNGLSNEIFLLFSLLGLALCFIWYFNIQTYKKLNSAKFKVINDMENQLPYACFNEEYKHLKQTKNARLTNVESKIPILFSVPYFLLFIYSIHQIFCE